MRFLPNWCIQKLSSRTSTASCSERDEAYQRGGEGGGGKGCGHCNPEIFQRVKSHLKSSAFEEGTLSPSKGAKTHLTNAAVTVVVATVVGVGVYFSRDYLRQMLLWVAQQEAWLVILVFLALFTMVSLPFMWGYIVVNVAAGYMFGTWCGLGVTVLTATLGVLIAHLLIRLCLRQVVQRRLVRSRRLRSLLEVLGGSHAFKVIAITRLTPIPFGLQNAVFAVSKVPTWLYLCASVLGLLPTQVLNSYLGTTVRSLDDVVTQSSSATTTGWAIFVVQILISVGLTMWVVRLAKAELNKTMAAQLGEPGDVGSSSSTSPPTPSTSHSRMTPSPLTPSTPLRQSSQRQHSFHTSTSVSPTPSLPPPPSSTLQFSSPSPPPSLPATLTHTPAHPTFRELCREAVVGRRRLRVLRRLGRLFHHQQVAPFPLFLIHGRHDLTRKPEDAQQNLIDDDVTPRFPVQTTADCWEARDDPLIFLQGNDVLQDFSSDNVYENNNKMNAAIEKQNANNQTRGNKQPLSTVYYVQGDGGTEDGTF